MGVSVGNKQTLKPLLCHKSSLKMFLLCKHPNWTTHLGDGVNNFSLTLCVFFFLAYFSKFISASCKNIKTELRDKDWKGVLCSLFSYFSQRKFNSLIRWPIFHHETYFLLPIVSIWTSTQATSHWLHWCCIVVPLQSLCFCFMGALLLGSITKSLSTCCSWQSPPSSVVNI